MAPSFVAGEVAFDARRLGRGELGGGGRDASGKVHGSTIARSLVVVGRQTPRHTRAFREDSSACLDKITCRGVELSGPAARRVLFAVQYF